MRIPDFDFDDPTPENCIKWIWALEAAGLAFHLDDDPNEVGYRNSAGVWLNTFSEHEACTLSAIRQVLFDIEGFDPHEHSVNASKFHAALREAQTAFWKSVASNYDEATSGDLSPAMSHSFDAVSFQALSEWVSNNGGEYAGPPAQ